MKRPNILFITTDHQQWRTIAGRSPCRMPNVQRLVDEGVLFDRAYAPAPVCCPVRAMWMTGAYPWHNGVHNQVHSAPSLNRDMFADVVTYSERLKAQGYRLGFAGKWHASHVRTPLDFGFDELAQGGGPPRKRPAWGRINPPVPVRDDLPPLREVVTREFRWPGSEPFAMWGHMEGPIERLPTTRLADSAIEMLRRFAAEHEPWHLAVHFPEPHDPYMPHADYLKRYDASAMPVPANFADDMADKPGMYRREADSWAPLTEEDVREGTAHYFAYCEQIDDQVGRILDALDASGQAERTLVAFTCDHGDMVGAHRMWIKGYPPFEETWHMPLVIRYPGRAPAGARCERLVQTHDLAHTFVEAAGAEALPWADGRSLLGLLANPARTDWEDAVLGVSYGCEFLWIQRLLITPRYKYVFNGFDYDEMYDLENDPDEMHNVVDDPQHAEARSRLRGQLYDLMNRFGDPYGDTGAEPGPSDPPNRYGAPRYLARR